MSYLDSFSLTRATLVVFFTALFFGSANVQLRAQANSDPFVEMRTNHGEQMMPDNWQRFRDHAIYDGSWNRSASLMYFPLVPPALGDELPDPVDEGLKTSLSDGFTRETFYGAYAVLLGRNQMPAKQSEIIAAYQRERQKLVEEIQSRFDELADAAPASRRNALNELATQQAARLAALVDNAEAIRRELSRVNAVFGYSLLSRSNDFRKGGGRFLQFVDAAYYFSGLSTEQRFLLSEMTYELTPGIASESQESRGSGNGTIFFWPATARIRLPDDLPAPIAEKVRLFLDEKESLKRELRSAVLRDNYRFGQQDIKALETLAEQQAPRFIALETLAEEIRVSLADFGYPVKPAQSTLPLDLTQRVGDFQVKKAEVKREMLARLRSMRKESPRARFEVARQGDGLAIVQTSGKVKSSTALVDFNAGLARRYTAFAEESRILRRDIQQYTEKNTSAVTLSVGQLAADFAKAYAARENWDRYRTYYRAVLEPGLSAAQRRLLFQAAVTEFDQARRPRKN